MLAPEKLKKYQKAKFANYKKINNLRIKNNEAYISLKVDNYDNIISEYSLTSSPSLKKEFIEAIENNTSIIPLDYPLVLEIHNKTFTTEEKNTVRKLLKNHFTLISIDKEAELKRINQKCLYFLIIGIVTFIISMLLYTSQIVSFYEILYFIASFSIWEFGELLIFARDDLKEEVIKYNQLSRLRITYNKEDS